MVIIVNVRKLAHILLRNKVSLTYRKEQKDMPAVASYGLIALERCMGEKGKERLRKREREREREDRKKGMLFGHFSLADVSHNDSLWHPLHTKEGDEISMFWGPCLQSSILRLSFSFLGLFFCYAVSSCVYDHNHPYLVSEASFPCRERGFSVPAESSGAPAESSGYTLRCSGDLTCGHFRGRRGEAEKPKNERGLRSGTSRSIAVPIPAGKVERALRRHFSIDFQTQYIVGKILSSSKRACFVFVNRTRNGRTASVRSLPTHRVRAWP